MGNTSATSNEIITAVSLNNNDVAFIKPVMDELNNCGASSIKPVMSGLNNDDIAYISSQSKLHIDSHYVNMLKSKPLQQNKTRPTRKNIR